ncbi:CopD family protein [uncultured Legionella sp.]|uniref:CopD family protein n=1 Tax=uncultured Legionella sp. TaxID=210934 RepID=UPI0026249484|nr:CopD family protein [uncultured Legionella sp.]
MLWVKAFHIITLVAWFAGLFYLPRLYVYHSESKDIISQERFKIMERRLYYGITWPSALVATALGLWLISFNLHYYLKAGWMHAKLALVLLLWAYHLICGHYLKLFAEDRNLKTSRFYRIFNELPVLLLTGIVIFVVVKPF